MFSDKRGAELVLYKLKKTLPIGSGFLPATYRESLFMYIKKCVYFLLCWNINPFCRLWLEAQRVCVAAA